MKRIFLLFLFLILLAGILVYYYRIHIVSKYVPKFEQQGEIQARLIDDTIYLKSIISIRNKLFCSIELDSVTYNIKIHHKSYLRDKIHIGKKLDAYKKDTFSFSISIPYISILKELKSELKVEDSTDYSLNLILHFDTPIGKIDIPFRKYSKFKLPQFPIFKIVDIDFKKIRKDEITADVRIRVNNSTKAELVLNNVNYQMQIYRAGSLKGSYPSKIILKPKSVSYVDLPIVISPLNFGKTVFQIVMNKDLYYYKLNLQAQMEATGPIKDTFNIKVLKNGRLELKKQKKRVRRKK